MRGRKPKPTALKLVGGNPTGAAINHDEPIPEGDLSSDDDADAPPAHFSAEQCVIWREALANAPVGMLKKPDASILEVWVHAFDLFRQASVGLKDGGLLVVGSNKTKHASPYIKIAAQQSAIMLRAAAALGFDPTSRSRIHVSPIGNNATGKNKKGALDKFRRA